MNDNPYQGPESQDDRSVINHPFAWILSAIFLVAGAAGCCAILDLVLAAGVDLNDETFTAEVSAGYVHPGQVL